MEDYKKKYEQAMLRMNKWVEGSEIIDPKEVAEFVFPELKESEDERIRKELINFFSKGAEYDSSTNGIKDRNIIAWLEKQGEQKPAWSEEDEKLYTWCASAIQTRYNDGLFTMDEYRETSLWLKSLKERMKGEIICG